jgi:hypothetical protein
MFAMFSCCSVNYLTVLAGGVSSLILGALWYSPMLFGGLMSPCKEPNRSMANCFVSEFINSLVMTWGLLALFNLIAPDTLVDGLQAGALVWLGGVFPALMSSHIWKGESLTDTLIAAGHHLAMISIVVALNFYMN